MEELEKLVSDIKSVDGVTKVESERLTDDTYTDPDKHLILLVWYDVKTYIEQGRKFRSSVLKKLVDNGWSLEDPLEDTGDYFYLVLKKKENVLKEDIANDDYEALFDEYMDKETYNRKNSSGIWDIELYADYNDKLSDSDIKDILTSKYPAAAFGDMLVGYYDDASYEELNLLKSGFVEYLVKNYKEVDEDAAGEWLTDNWYDVIDIRPDYDHFREQEVNCLLVLDTGDANYDFALNPAYHNKYGGEGLDDKASIVWLVKQQGYTKEDLVKALENEGSDNKFLNSVVEECINNAGEMTAVCFLGNVKLGDLLDGEVESVTVKSHDSYVGLVDLWDGSGSSLDIKLEKDVVVPKDIIWYFGPDIDTAQTYSVDSIYGLSKGAYNSEFVVDTKKNEAVIPVRKTRLEESVERVKRGLLYLNRNVKDNKDLKESVEEIKNAFSEVIEKYFKK